MPGSFTLVFETSTPSASLLLAGTDGTCRERTFSSDRSHNAVLFGPLAELLEPVDPTEIGMILVGSGPGSYSGTRVGIAAAQGVALAAGCPVVALPSILATPSAAEGKACRIAGDARRGSFWTAAVDASKVTREPQLVAEEAFGQALADAGDGPIVTFENLARTTFPEGLNIAQETPTARLLWKAWQASGPVEQQRWGALIPQPLYLRPPHITEPKRPTAGRL